jgi:NACHT domain
LYCRVFFTVYGDFSGISLCVIGVSGAGKTALMAKLANELFRIDPRRPVILRFCGTSKDSSTGLQLVRSICIQIMLVNADLASISTVPATYKDAVKCLHGLLERHPVFLLIDSLDQLSDADMARSRISFLDGVVPHPLTRIVVSALPDERDASGKWIYCYGCSTRLRGDSVPEVTVNKLSSHNDEMVRIFTSLLRRKGMTLVADQMAYAVAQTSLEATALYVRLACREIETWRSSDDVVGSLPGTVIALINKIFDDLETTFGLTLVQGALGYLTFSVGGVSDREMEDLLSLDDEVLNFVFEYSDPGVKRCPSHVWLRLRAALTGLLVERAGGCWTWYHRQLKEVAERRYSPFKEKLHRVMGRYFGNIDSPIGTRAERSVAVQPLWYGEIPVWFDGCRINARRCSEAIHHFVECGMITEAAGMLCDVSSICAHLKAGEGFKLVDYSSRALQLGTISQLNRALLDRLSHYTRWLRQDMTFIVESPVMHINASIGNQPLSSFVRKEWELFVKRTRSTDGPNRCRLLIHFS